MRLRRCSNAAWRSCEQRATGLQLDIARALCLGVRAWSAINRAVFETDDDANERIAPSIDIRDVSVAELAIPKHLSDRGHVNPEHPFFHENVRPDAINEFLLGDDVAGTICEIDQDIQRPAAQREHQTVAPERPFPARQFKRTESQFHLAPLLNGVFGPTRCARAPKELSVQLRRRWSLDALTCAMAN